LLSRFPALSVGSLSRLAAKSREIFLNKIQQVDHNITHTRCPSVLLAAEDFASNNKMKMKIRKRIHQKFPSLRQQLNVKRASL